MAPQIALLKWSSCDLILQGCGSTMLLISVVMSFEYHEA